MQELLNQYFGTLAGLLRDAKVTTFPGFTEDSDLRRTGAGNVYIRSRGCGFVEVSHPARCHAVLDIDMGRGKSA